MSVETFRCLYFANHSFISTGMVILLIHSLLVGDEPARS